MNLEAFALHSSAAGALYCPADWPWVSVPVLLYILRVVTWRRCAQLQSGLDTLRLSMCTTFRRSSSD